MTISNSNIVASYSDSESKVIYYGWDSNYLGSLSSSKNISVGKHTFYVMDKGGNKTSCSINITNASSSYYCPSCTYCFNPNTTNGVCITNTCSPNYCLSTVENARKKYTCSSGINVGSYCYSY